MKHYDVKPPPIHYSSPTHISLTFIQHPQQPQYSIPTHHITHNNDNTINTNTINTSPKIYRPKLASQYIVPDIYPDLLDGMEFLYNIYGPSLRHHTSVLAPRDDIIIFSPYKDQQELNNNIRWHQRPEALRDQILQIIKDYWDVFCEEGLRRNIRGYSCRIDTGDISPVCCKSPRYGPHG
jgi:hypothetical protein